MVLDNASSTASRSRKKLEDTAAMNTHHPISVALFMVSATASFFTFAQTATQSNDAKQAALPPRTLEHLAESCVKPRYPAVARRREAEGSTQLTFVVDPIGVISQIEVLKSSGDTGAHKALDKAAVDAISTCRYPPSSGFGPVRAKTQYVWKMESYADVIRSAIRSKIIFDEEFEGNPTTEMELRTAPDGTIISTKLLKASESPQWDAAVQRALLKLDKLPLDIDGKVPPVLVVVLRPKL